ncbi:pyridoxamine 5'-phosphate oxidase family protein [Streptomyces sp. NPDC052109]|uniref:pyridoxamine 5'-phosphate oxidase family protein n=1 Tax=Streptomyces sp. NPDC052109 TaxID=3155527 RepID=UPI0034251255
MISEATTAFLAEPLPIVVGTRRRDGRVKMTPAWFEFQDGFFWLNSRRGTYWLAHVERERRASLLLIDPHDMYRVVHAETRLTGTTTEGAGAHLDRLSHRYRGEPYRALAPMTRVIVQLEPLTVRSTLDGRP